MPEKKKSARKALFHSKQTIRVHTKHLSATFSTEGQGFGVVLSKKTLPKSVDRHRLKRRITNILRHILPKKTLYVLIIFPKAATLHLTPTNLREELQNLLSEVQFSGKIEKK